MKIEKARRTSFNIGEFAGSTCMHWILSKPIKTKPDPYINAPRLYHFVIKPFPEIAYLYCQ